MTSIDSNKTRKALNGLDTTGLGIHYPENSEGAKGERTSPHALVAALLSEASYVGKSKAFGWSGIGQERLLANEAAEEMRRTLASGGALDEAQAKALRESFWRDDLMMLTMDEIEARADLPERREELARRLWVALYSRPAIDALLDKGLAGASRANGASENRDRATTANKDPLHADVRFSRPGVFRATDVHCAIYASVWTPEKGFGEANADVWIAFRGTENNAKALQSPVKTFFMDYAFKAYRSFAKTYRARYKDSVDAFLTATDHRPKAERPKRIIFVGHSLGGSEAIEGIIQGRADFAKRGIKTEGYTFGSPGTGAVGALSVAASVPFAAAAGLAHAARVAWELIPGNAPQEGLLAKKADGLQNFARLARVYASKMANIITKAPGVNGANRLSQIAGNLMDSLGSWRLSHPWRSINHGMLGIGAKTFSTGADADWAEASGGMVHYAHRRDFVRVVGECSGFSLPGRTQLIDTCQAAGGPVKEHSCSMYVSSIQSLLIRENEGAHPWVQGLVGCRLAVNEMLAQQAILHRNAIVSGQERGFIDGELQSSVSTDQNEAALWVRERLALQNAALASQGNQLLLGELAGKRFEKFQALGAAQVFAQSSEASDCVASPNGTLLCDLRVGAQPKPAHWRQGEPMRFSTIRADKKVAVAYRYYAEKVFASASSEMADRLAQGKSRLSLGSVAAERALQSARSPLGDEAPDAPWAAKRLFKLSLDGSAPANVSMAFGPRLKERRQGRAAIAVARNAPAVESSDEPLGMASKIR